MALEIEEVEMKSNDQCCCGGAKAAMENESLKNDVYTAVAYRDMEKLQRLVESQGYFVSELDGHGYYALQWAALNSRIAAVQYIIAVCELYIHSYMYHKHF